jgi:adenylate cyclase class 2
MLEIEMKFPVKDFGAVADRLKEWGAPAEPPRQEADHYFNAPDRDFAQTDEALRLRCIGPINRLTYKGPKESGVTKTRTEIEVPLAEGSAAAEDLRRLLVHLGYRPVAVVRKTRICYHLNREGFALEVTLDDVEQVGRFVEVEILAAEETKTAAQEVLLRIAAELQLTQSERRSYLELLLALSRVV